MSHDIEKLHFPTEEPTNPRAPDEQAAAWAAYLHSGQASEEGQQKFSEWLASSDANPLAYQKVEQWWQDFDYPAVMLDEDNVKQKVVYPEFLSGNTEKKTVQSGSGLRSIVAIAASIIIMFGVWKVAFFDQATYYTSIVGEIRTVSLSDGSLITLGGDTEIEVNLSGDTRDVDLKKGRAWFDVAHDKNRAFIVQVGEARIKVLGTAFDVNRAVGKIRISVERGKVEVATSDKNGRKNSVQLSIGEQVTTALGQFDEVKSFDPARELSWRTGRLEYVDIPLAEVIAEINRYREEKIIFVDKNLKDMEITMAVAVDETELLLSGLEAMSLIVIKRTAAGIRIEESKSTK